jgi:serine/threonine-protein kinase
MELTYYEIERRLADNPGSSILYFARDTKLNREVVLRVLDPGGYFDHDRMQRIAQRTKAALALKHRNIATIYETWETPGKLFIATEYITGEPLRAGAELLSAAAVVGIAMEIADALIHAHGLGIVHGGIEHHDNT